MSNIPPAPSMDDLRQLRGRILAYEKNARRPQVIFRRYFNRRLRAERLASSSSAVRGGGPTAESERVAAALAVLAKHPYHHPCATRTHKETYGEITTEVLAAPTFYYAEDYHQQYLHKNPGGYCGLGGTGVSCPIGTGVVETGP